MNRTSERLTSERLNDFRSYRLSLGVTRVTPHFRSVDVTCASRAEVSRGATPGVARDAKTQTRRLVHASSSRAAGAVSVSRSAARLCFSSPFSRRSISRANSYIPRNTVAIAPKNEGGDAGFCVFENASAPPPPSSHPPKGKPAGKPDEPNGKDVAFGKISGDVIPEPPYVLVA